MHPVFPIPTVTYGSFSELDDDLDIALVYSKAAFDKIRRRKGCFRPFTKAEVKEATEEHWNALSEQLKGDVIYAVGGGLAVDAAKYIASQRNLPLVCLPTALTVDAFFTWASGVRHGGCVRYLGTKVPDEVIVDFEILCSAPPNLRAAGICDVLSIATGCWDWKYAHEKGMNPSGMEFVEYVYDAAQAILDGTLECAEAAGRGDGEGIKQLLQCLLLEVQLCNTMGHARPEEGSEHYFAYAVENRMGKGLPHGDLVGPGILIMSRLQGQETNRLRKALTDCHIPLDRIPQNVALETLAGLPQYCREHQMPHGIAHDVTEEMIGITRDFL